MEIMSEQDFHTVRSYIIKLYQRFPMFRHNVVEIEKNLEEYIKQHSIAMVYYRQTRQTKYLKDAQNQINNINRTLEITEKMQLMSLLSQA